MAKKQPNILVIFGDDIGYWNISSFGGDTMGVATPNIDRIGHEGIRLTSFYAQPSCTAGRAAFITGQMPARTGLTTVGCAGAPQGMSEKDPTIAQIMKMAGYATAQFGKNHLGDREEHLPHRHGFDEFFGNLYPSMPMKIRKIRIARRPRNSNRNGACAASCREPRTVRPRMRAS